MPTADTQALEAVARAPETMTRAECDLLALEVLMHCPDGFVVDLADLDDDGSNGGAISAMLIYLGHTRAGRCTHTKLGGSRARFDITPAGRAMLSAHAAQDAERGA